MIAKSHLVAILLLALLCNCNADLIDEVCSKSLDPGFCTKTLRSGQRSRGADLRGLGKIAIHKSLAATRLTQRVAKSFSAGGSKARADACAEYCTDAIDLLNECSALLRARGGEAIDDLRTKGSAALTYMGTCDDEFESGEPLKLKNASKVTQDLIGILLVIAHLL